MSTVLLLLLGLGRGLSAFDFGSDDDEQSEEPEPLAPEVPDEEPQPPTPDVPDEEPATPDPDDPIAGSTFEVRSGDVVTGTAGDDVFDWGIRASATADGGDGDDRFEIGGGSVPDNTLPSESVLTGGAGADVYAVDGLISDSGNTRYDLHIITDFDPNEDVIEVTVPGKTESLIVDVEVEAAEDGSYTDVRFVFETPFLGTFEDAGSEYFEDSDQTLRLMGQSEFDTSLIQFKANPGFFDPGTPPLEGEVGSEGDDTLSGSGEGSILFGRAGNDTVSNAQIAQLGEGDDTYIAGGKEWFVDLEDGDDVYQGADALHDPDHFSRQGFILGGEGDDTIHSGEFFGTIYGGRGDDFLVADPDAYFETSNGAYTPGLNGDAGDDTLEFHIGQKVSLGTGNDTAILNVDPAHLARDPGLIEDFASSDNLVLNVPSALIGQLTVETEYADSNGTGEHAAHIYRISGTEVLRVEAEASYNHDQFTGPPATLTDNHLTINVI